MFVPIVTKETREQVWKEVKEIEARGDSFAVKMMHRLGSRELYREKAKEENPVIADFLFKIYESHRHEPWIAKAISYGYLVYRMVEIQSGGKLPLISTEVGAPIQADFFRNIQSYGQNLMKRIMKENYHVSVASTDFMWIEAMSDNPSERHGASMVAIIGHLVYRFIESQFESNELNKLLTR